METKLTTSLAGFKRRISRSTYVPRQWQAPQAPGARRAHQNLSATSLTNENSPCRLLQLPYELRLQIYELVIQDPPVIAGVASEDELDEKRSSLLGHVSDYPINCLWRGKIPGRLVAQPPSPPDCAGSQYAPHRLGLLRTCKQIYMETINLMYSIPTFLVQDLPVLSDILVTFLPKRLVHVRNLQVQFILRWAEISSWWINPKSTPDNAVMWAKLWTRVHERMLGLRRLSVYIRQFTWDYGINSVTEVKVLEPLMRLRGLEEFRLWYRHEKVLDPFGYSYKTLYTFDLLGEECHDERAVEYKRLLETTVKLPRGVTREHA